MGKPSNIFNFLAYAKTCSCTLACKYVKDVNHGKDGTSLMNKIRLLDSYIDEIENYIYTCCKDFYENGIKHFCGRKITMSKNNSLYLTSEDQKIHIESSDLNCLTEEQICELASRIKGICINC
jgi:hypothetical protein